MGRAAVVTYHCHAVFKRWLRLSGIRQHTMWYEFRLLRLDSTELVRLPCGLILVFEPGLWECLKTKQTKNKKQKTSGLKKLMYWLLVKRYQDFHEMISIMAIKTITGIVASLRGRCYGRYLLTLERSCAMYSLNLQVKSETNGWIKSLVNFGSYPKVFCSMRSSSGLYMWFEGLDSSEWIKHQSTLAGLWLRGGWQMLAELPQAFW